MPNRVAAPPVRTSAAPQPKTPAKPAKSAAPPAQTAAAGWGTGASKAPTSLKITQASLGDGPKTTDAVAVPRGFKAELKPLTQNLKDRVHGKEVTLEQSATQLTLTTPAGKKLQIGSAGGMKETASDWRAEVAGYKKEPANEYMTLGWDNQQSIRGAGTAGKMVSVMEGGSSYTGGAHPNHYSALATYDASTGKAVKLDSLLTQQQMTNLVRDIGKKLETMKGPDDIGVDAFNMGGDGALLREAINDNFALTTDKSGKVQLQIAWESGIHALGGVMAHFTVDAPADAAFRQKIGLE